MYTTIKRIILVWTKSPNIKVILNYKFVTSLSPDLSKQVSMFKKNYDHLPKDTYFGMYKDSVRGNPNYFLTYGNGKSAARIQDHLRPNGAHRWHNYMKTPKYDPWIHKTCVSLDFFVITLIVLLNYASEIKLEEAAVLHYTYAKFSDLTSRRDRCGCKPTKEDVKRCFMLEFDRSVSFRILLFFVLSCSVICFDCMSENRISYTGM